MASGFGESGQAGAASSFPGFPVGFGISGISVFYAVSGVAKNTPTVIGAYTVPAGVSFYLQCVELGGSNIGLYTVSVDGTPVASVRSWFNGPFVHNVRFDGTGNLGLFLVSGSVVQISVTHPRPDIGDFEARVIGAVK